MLPYLRTSQICETFAMIVSDMGLGASFFYYGSLDIWGQIIHYRSLSLTCSQIMHQVCFSDYWYDFTRMRRGAHIRFLFTDIQIPIPMGMRHASEASTEKLSFTLESFLKRRWLDTMLEPQFGHWENKLIWTLKTSNSTRKTWNWKILFLLICILCAPCVVREDRCELSTVWNKNVMVNFCFIPMCPTCQGCNMQKI